MCYFYTILPLTLIVINLSVDLGMFLDTLMWAPEASYKYNRKGCGQKEKSDHIISIQD